MQANIKSMTLNSLSFSIFIFILASLATPVTYAEDAHPAANVVKETTTKIFAEIKASEALIKKDPKELYRLVSATVLPHFDFDKMSNWVLGKHWRKATKDQKIQFTQQFRTLLVRTYANALAGNIDQKITYNPPRIKNEKKVSVRTEIEQKGTFPLPINYRMHLTDNKWKVYDVIIDGISLVTNYKSSFANELRKDTIEALIKKLQQRNEKAVSK